MRPRGRQAGLGRLGALLLAMALLGLPGEAAAQGPLRVEVTANPSATYVESGSRIDICGRVATSGPVLPPSPANRNVELLRREFPYDTSSLSPSGFTRTGASGEFCFVGVQVAMNTRFYVDTEVNDESARSAPIEIIVPAGGVSETKTEVLGKRRPRLHVEMAWAFPVRGITALGRPAIAGHQVFWYHRKEDQRLYRLMRISESDGLEAGGMQASANWRVNWRKQAYSVVWCIEIPGGVRDVGLGVPRDHTCPREPFPEGTPLPGFD